MAFKEERAEKPTTPDRGLLPNEERAEQATEGRGATTLGSMSSEPKSIVSKPVSETRGEADGDCRAGNAEGTTNAEPL